MRRDTKPLIKSSRRGKKKRPYGKKKIIFFLSLLVFLGGASFILKSPAMDIKKVEVSGTRALSGEEVETEIKNYLSEKYWGLFSKSNIFFFRESEIRERILGKWSGVRDAEVSFSNLASIGVKIAERSPRYLLCEGTSPAKGEKCVFLDEEGVVFGEGNGSGEYYPKIYGYSGEIPASGSYADKKKLSPILPAVLSVKKFSLSPSHVFFREDGDLEIYLSGGKKVILRGSGDFEKTILNLEAVLGSEVSSGKILAEESFKYIDLRFGNKIFYK